MKRHLHPLVNVSLLLSLLLVTACSKKTPTPGPEAVYTSAAATVEAQLKERGPVTGVPTTTPFVFKTPSATAPPAKASTATLPPAVAPTTPAAGATMPSTPDRAVWVAQSPADGSQVVAGSTFQMTWTVKNTGTTKWTTAYQLRYWAGEKFGSPATVNLPKEVNPEEQMDITVSLTAPRNTGEYHGIWVLSTAEGANFYPLDVDLKVVLAPTATATTASCSTDPSLCTPTPTLTPEAGGD